MLSTKKWPILDFKKKYIRSLAPADFSSAVFTHAYFQKIAQISSLCDFHYINEEIPSLMRFWLLITYDLRFGSCGFLPGVIPHIFGTKVGNSGHSDDDRSVASFNPAKKHVGICNKTFRFYGWKLNQWEREIYIV